MTLAVDIGNSRTKLALFENDTIKSTQILKSEEIEKEFLKIFKKSKDRIQIIVSSVGKWDSNTLNWLNQYAETIFITSKTPMPYENLYQTPTSLGIDRMVLVAGAVLNKPKGNTLIIDAGTCITFDFVNQKNQYLGGSISPGLVLRYKSLNDYTSKLPLLTPTLPDQLVGNSTTQAIHSGIINGIVSEIDGLIDIYKQEYPNLTIILTGGDAEFLAKRLKNTIFANSNFLLESLNSLHQYLIIENDKKNLP